MIDHYVGEHILQSCRSQREKHNGKLRVPAHFYITLEPFLPLLFLIQSCESCQGVPKGHFLQDRSVSRHCRGLIRCTFNYSSHLTAILHNMLERKNEINSTHTSFICKCIEYIGLISIAHIYCVNLAISLPPTPLFLK